MPQLFYFQLSILCTGVISVSNFSLKIIPLFKGEVEGERENVRESLPQKGELWDVTRWKHD